MEALAGIYLLHIIFTQFPTDPEWNPYTVQFSSFDDCVVAGDLFGLGQIPKKGYIMNCTSVAGEIHAAWNYVTQDLTDVLPTTSP